jgi:hypothetical protein
MNRPAIVTDEMLRYLDELRARGVTSFGKYLQAEFLLSKKDARRVLIYWLAGQEGRFVWKPGEVEVTAPVDKGEEVFTIDKDIGKVFDYYKGSKAK